MKLRITVIFMCCLISSCSIFNLDNNQNNDRLARCKQLNSLIVSNGFSGDQMVEAQDAAQRARLNSDYQRLGCS